MPSSLFQKKSIPGSDSTYKRKTPTKKKHVDAPVFTL
jgi:hypothetical protein